VSDFFFFLETKKWLNPFIDKWLTFRYFFFEKTLLLKFSYAFVVIPGGFGTLDEYFEALTLIKTKKISSFPIVVFDTAFHKHLIEHIEKMKSEGTISDTDTSLFLFTDSVEEAVTYIRENTIRQFNLTPEKTYKPYKPFKLTIEKRYIFFLFESLVLENGSIKIYTVINIFFHRR